MPDSVDASAAAFGAASGMEAETSGQGRTVMQPDVGRERDSGGDVFHRQIVSLAMMLGMMVAAVYGQASPVNRPAPAEAVYIGAQQLPYEHHL